MRRLISAAFWLMRLIGGAIKRNVAAMAGQEAGNHPQQG